MAEIDERRLLLDDLGRNVRQRAREAIRRSMAGNRYPFLERIQDRLIAFRINSLEKKLAKFPDGPTSVETLRPGEELARGGRVRIYLPIWMRDEISALSVIPLGLVGTMAANDLNDYRDGLGGLWTDISDRGLDCGSIHEAWHCKESTSLTSTSEGLIRDPRSGEPSDTTNIRLQVTLSAPSYQIVRNALIDFKAREGGGAIVSIDAPPQLRVGPRRQLNPDEKRDFHGSDSGPFPVALVHVHMFQAEPARPGQLQRVGYIPEPGDYRAPVETVVIRCGA